MFSRVMRRTTPGRSPAGIAQEDLEGQQTPDRVTVVRNAGHVLVEEIADGTGYEVLVDPSISRQQHRLGVAAEIRAEPTIEWNPEAALAAPKDVVREEVSL